MRDIRHYADQELSLLFLNEEELYRHLMRAVRRNDFSIVKDLCDDYFLYSDDQLENLRETFNEELQEYEN
jgi:hypothetical protein